MPAQARGRIHGVCASLVEVPDNKKRRSEPAHAFQWMLLIPPRVMQSPWRPPFPGSPGCTHARAAPRRWRREDAGNCEWSWSRPCFTSRVHKGLLYTVECAREMMSLGPGGLG
ncbi:hypothetical protein ANANG_G00215880 [Anguilla anguilla]|uniref:Uncharacterized protein n=1 Tax=Anguilla anguilla TaxID=7936 RepID=A0A9D3LZ05_ANGAN|nr:hypothetical protein ANANG_G00215880 [Anguilla anguilla]